MIHFWLVTLCSDFSFTYHVTEVLVTCACSLYFICILTSHGLTSYSLHTVTKATTLSRLLYAAPACITTRSPPTKPEENDSFRGWLEWTTYLKTVHHLGLTIINLNWLLWMLLSFIPNTYSDPCYSPLSSSVVLAFTSATTPLSCHPKILRTS